MWSHEKRAWASRVYSPGSPDSPDSSEDRDQEVEFKNRPRAGGKPGSSDALLICSQAIYATSLQEKACFRIFTSRAEGSTSSWPARGCEAGGWQGRVCWNDSKMGGIRKSGYPFGSSSENYGVGGIFGVPLLWELPKSWHDAHVSRSCRCTRLPNITCPLQRLQCHAQSLDAASKFSRPWVHVEHSCLPRSAPWLTVAQALANSFARPSTRFGPRTRNARGCGEQQEQEQVPAYPSTANTAHIPMAVGTPVLLCISSSAASEALRCFKLLRWFANHLQS